MRRTAGLLAGVVGLLAVAGSGPAGAQTGMMQHVDLTSPKMSEAELSREEVIALLEAATAEQPAKLADMGLNGLDLSGLDLSGVDLSRSRLNRVNLKGAVLRGAKLDLAWLIEADLEDADLRDVSMIQAQLHQGAACRRRSLGRPGGRQLRGRESRGCEADQRQHGARHEKPVDGPDAHRVPLGRARSRRSLGHRSRLGRHGVRQAAGQRAGRRRLQHGAPGRRRHDRRERERDERRRRQPRLGASCAS